jgi:hypothetical protein
VQFDARNVIAAPPDAVLRALCDRAFWAALGPLPTTHAPELVSIDEHGGEVRTRVRYRFRGDLPRAVTRVVDPARLSWVEETLWDLDAREGHTTIRPDHYAEKIHATAVTRLLDDPIGCARLVHGELRVRVPLVGSQAEAPIVSGLRRNLAALGETLAAWIR